ncbi:hypothetical protein [Flammeovirga sp. EKP202]|uniref:hypothetical protein n=1 Tax=Flammeovirga sp. EKP202 TaxID=2770592 RepID=UPI00165F3732|nr:hypothetical protein [Flammeovirga sp. EKP202]MBD0402629.1 hypothetical protein [Flammeovirga sp. EKP202]
MSDQKYCIQLKATLLHLPSNNKPKKYHFKYFIVTTIILVILCIFLGNIYSEDQYKGFIICLYLLSSLPLVTYFFLEVDFDTLNVYETYPLIGKIEFNSDTLYVNEEELSIDSIQQIKLDFIQHGNISWSIIDEQIKAGFIQNPNKVSLGGRNGYHLQKTYNSIIIYPKKGSANRYSFFIDKVTTEDTVLAFINFCYHNGINFKEYTNGIRSYKMKNDLTYDEIQQIKQEHDLKSWV